MEKMHAPTTYVSHLACSKCGQEFDIKSLQTFATCCERPLIVRYNFLDLGKEELIGRPLNMWRYREVLPVIHDENIVSLSEGMTPILDMPRLSQQYGLRTVILKDEGLNPTGSFKSRGLSMAVSKAKELGVTECVIPTAGNAGGALSAYCARAGMKVTVLMPDITPVIFQEECKFYGADLILVDGLIDRCGELSKEVQERTGAFNMSTLKEPYRIEGKKTMGYEIAEQLNWQLPDVIIYPTGGGTGLIGIWKAFKEMVELGWIHEEDLPKMVVVQTENCAPVVKYIHGQEIDEATIKRSIANGLAVPKAFGRDLIKETVEESNGYAITVSEDQIYESTLEIGSQEGISVATEGGAIWAALKDLVSDGRVKSDEKILLLNTGSGNKYLENLRNYR